MTSPTPEMSKCECEKCTKRMTSPTPEMKELSTDCKYCGLPKDICRIAELAAFALEPDNKDTKLFESNCSKIIDLIDASYKRGVEKTSVEIGQKISYWRSTYRYSDTVIISKIEDELQALNQTHREE